MVFRGRIGREIKDEAKLQAPATIDRVAALLGGNLEAAIDTFGVRLREFVGQAGETLARGIAEVLDRALVEKRARQQDHHDPSGDATEIAAVTAELRAIDEQLADVRQTLWQT